MSIVQPVTERRNHLSESIDLASPEGIVEVLKCCDREIFQEYAHGFKSMLNADIIATVEAVSEIVAEILQDPQDGLIVLSGCGTSGRLAFLTARNVNAYLRNEGRQPAVSYIIAGGDKALFMSQESPEDDPVAGVNMLKLMAGSKKRVVYIGVTCGLSAPFVAGQLDYCLSRLDIFTPVLIGFNPSDMARNTPVENWNTTVHAVVQSLVQAAERGEAFLINPVVGPEAIGGSSRMKGGSATKILLDIIFVLACGTYCNQREALKILLAIYESTMESFYSAALGISSAIEMAGKSLQKGGKIVYIGADGAGIMGMIDASECVPTYGAGPDDVKGFLRGGYHALNNTEGDLSHLGHQYNVSTDHFYSQVALELGTDDTVIILSSQEGLIDAELSKCKANKILCVLGARGRQSAIGKATSASCIESFVQFDMTVDIIVPQTNTLTACLTSPSCLQALLQDGLQQFATKLFCNAVTTGAHVLLGKVYQNIMVDVRISNVKLYWRAVNTVKEIGACTCNEAERYLQETVLQCDQSQEAAAADGINTALSITKIVRLASNKDRVVPTAIIMALTKLKFNEARIWLSKESSVRLVISHLLPM